MGTYTVEYREATPQGSDPSAHLADQKHVAATAIEAVSAREAVAQAMDLLPQGAEPELFFVPDNNGRVDVFWPHGEPVGLERRDLETPADEICSIRLTEQCEVRGTAENGALFVIEGDRQFWVCESCALFIEQLI
jgi:hypothetical protein